MDILTNPAVALGLLGGGITLFTQVLKKTKVPTKKPKLVAFILSLVIFGLIGLFSGASADTVAEIVSISTVISYGLYDLLKPIPGEFRKAYKAYKDGIDKLRG